MKGILIAGAMLICSFSLMAQYPSGNTVKSSRTIISSSSQMPSSVKSLRSEVAYYDGFGEFFCRAQTGQSPSGSDLITLLNHDPLGRVETEYLPYAGGANDYSSMLQEQGSFYRTALRAAHTLYPFSRYAYDPWIAGRITEQSHPGYSWRPGSLHVSRQSMRVNQSSEVRKLEIAAGGTLSDLGYYPPGVTRVIELTDEQGVVSRKYYTFSGNLLLEVKACGSSSEVSTYYVYDAADRIRMVLQPNAVKALSLASQWHIGLVDDDFIFRYEYDGRNRVSVSKPSSGAEILTVYDRMGRAAMSQDGRQREHGLWWVRLYDHQDRIVVEGLLRDDDHLTQSQWQSKLDSLQNVNPAGMTSAVRKFSGAARYQLPDWITPANLGVLLYYHYDDYQGIGSPAASVDATPGARRSCMGLMTARYSALLDSSSTGWHEEVFAYDNDLNLIQTISRLPGGLEYRSGSRFNLAGDLLSERKEWLLPADYGNLSLALDYVYEHDQAGRVRKLKLRKDGSEFLLAGFNYNEAGQLIETNLGSADGGLNFWQSLDYSYNPRGWLTHVNNAGLKDDKAEKNFRNDTEAGEALQAIVFDELSLRIGQNAGLIDYDLEINEMKELKYENVQSGILSVIPMEEFAQEKLSAADLDTLGIAQLESLEGEMIQLDFNSLPLLEGMDAQALLDTALSLLSDELASNGITDPGLLTLISNQLIAYLKSRLSLAYTNDDSNDLFGMEIRYQNPAGNGMPRYNGDISMIDWRTRTPSNPAMRYGYHYDDLSRLTAADYSSQDASGHYSNLAEDYSVQSILYDGNGNITHIKRMGVQAISAAGTKSFGGIDDLSYSYEGNRLTKVTDAIGAGVSSISGFRPPAVPGASSHYSYDSDGRMISDLNKGLTIRYNEIGLPYVVKANGGQDSVLFRYDASGRKLQQARVAGGQTSGIQYLGDAVFHDKQLVFVRHPFGRIRWIGQNPRIEFDLKDHLGNMRVSFSDLNNDGKADLIQENHYYPFGMEMEGKSEYSGNADNPYRFNSKELICGGMLDWYDFGARFFDPALARWLGTDPLSTRREWQTPYNAFSNNPISRTDPDGMLDDNYWIFENGTVAKETTSSPTNTYTLVREDGSRVDLGTYDVVPDMLQSYAGTAQMKDMVNLEGLDNSYLKTKYIQSGNYYLGEDELASFLASAYLTHAAVGKAVFINQLNGINGRHSGHGSLGDRIDLQYIRTDGAEGRCFTSDDIFDIESNAVLVDYLAAFGFNNRYSQIFGTNLPALQNTIYSNGHHHHLHVDSGGSISERYRKQHGNWSVMQPASATSNPLRLPKDEERTLINH